MVDVAAGIVADGGANVGGERIEILNYESMKKDLEEQKLKLDFKKNCEPNIGRKILIVCFLI